MNKMSVIPTIVENKKIRLAESKKTLSTEDLEKKAFDYVSTKTSTHRFLEQLKKDYVNLIAEYKPASPSQGDISSLSVENVIPLYQENPVDMISVLTEESYFKSNIENLKTATKLTDKPILRKDFVIDKYMIYEAALYDCSAVLLINGVCPDIEEYLNLTHELCLDAIVECHNIDDINSVVEYDPMIVGVNNRNLDTLEINLDTTKNLREFVPHYMISESGVLSIDDAKLLKSYDADALLIGTSLLKDKNPHQIEEFIDKLTETLKN